MTIENVSTHKAAAPRKKRSFGEMLVEFSQMREFTLLVIIVVMFIGMSFASPYFLTWANMKAMLLSFSTEGIVVVGMTMLLIVGGLICPLGR